VIGVEDAPEDHVEPAGKVYVGEVNPEVFVFPGVPVPLSKLVSKLLMLEVSKVEVAGAEPVRRPTIVFPVFVAA
jgi:molybdopterin-biosynthesis enzyme MoeA-like protein